MQETKETMLEMFKGYIGYSDEEYKKIWKEAIIVVDTNILLNLYRYSEPARETMLNILKNVKDRIWIPYQVGKEFFKNKDKVMFETFEEYDKLAKALSAGINKAKDEVNHKKDNRLKSKEKINAVLEKDIKEKEQLLKKEQEEKKQILSEDKIEKVVLEIFNHNIGLPFLEDEFSKIREEGIRRKNNDIPPGYKDKDKEENGDYYVFYSIIQKAKQDAKDVIFITDDEKEDWFNKYNGENHGGRSELLDEFYHKTGKLLLMYTTDGFVQAYNKNMGQEKIDKDIIQEFKNYRKNISKELNAYNIKAFEYYEDEYLNFINNNISKKLYKLNYKNIESTQEEQMLLNVIKKNKKIQSVLQEKLYTTYMQCKIKLENEKNNIKDIYNEIRENINVHIILLKEITNQLNDKLIYILELLKYEIEMQLRNEKLDKTTIIILLNNILD